jgi:hypothetical protein
MLPEMEPASNSTTALLICNGSSSEAIGGGGETAKGAGHQGRLCALLPVREWDRDIFSSASRCFLGGAVLIRLWKSPKSCCQSRPQGGQDRSDRGEMKLREGKGEDRICVGKKVREHKARRERGKWGPPVSALTIGQHRCERCMERTAENLFANVDALLRRVAPRS